MTYIRYANRICYRKTEDKSQKCNLADSAAAAAAESRQSCPTLCDPRDGSPPGSSVHGIFQARVLEWGATAFSNCLANRREKVETVMGFLFLDSKITADGDCSHEI